MQLRPATRLKKASTKWSKQWIADHQDESEINGKNYFESLVNELTIDGKTTNGGRNLWKVYARSRPGGEAFHIGMIQMLDSFQVSEWAD